MRVCYEYLNSPGKPYSYKDVLEFARASFLYPQYLQVGEVLFSMNPPESIDNLSNENKPRQISYAALEKTSFLVNSIGFEGSTKNCVAVVRAERQLISLEGNMVDFEDESNPLFICEGYGLQFRTP